MLDIVTKTGADRGRTIPRVDWWCDLATREANTSGLSRRDLAAEVVRRGLETSSTAVVRCLSGDILSVELARVLSSILAIPPPLFVPSTEGEAYAIVRAIELHRVRVQVQILKAGVETSESSRQPGPVASGDGAVSRRQPKHGRARS